MRELQAKDLYRHRVLGQLHGVAGGHRFILSVKRAAERKDDYRTTVWFWEGNERRVGIRSKLHPSSCRLSNDGTRVAFLSRNRKGGMEIRVQDFDADDSRAIGEASSEWQTIEQWSPDGRRLLLTRKVAWREDSFDDPSRGKDRPIVAPYLPYKQDGGGPRAGFRTRLVEMDLTTGTQRTLVEGDFDVQQGAWSPDAARLAFIRTRSGQQRHRSDLWLAEADGSEARQLTSHLAAVNKLAWSPDSRSIALAASEQEGDSLAELHVLPLEGGCARRVAPELHLESPEPVWLPDSRRVAVAASYRGLVEVALVDTQDGAVDFFDGGLRHVTALAPVRGGFVLVTATMRRLCEVERCDLGGGRRERLSHFNTRWFAEGRRPIVEKRSFRVPDGRGGVEDVEAWVLLPSHAQAPFPAYVDIHGGPQSGALIDFSNHLYWYLLVSRGWAVVAPNAVGSSGYGDEFARRLRGHWGEYDLPQYLAILQALRAEGVVAGPAACGGKSYGGYLAAYAAGHCEEFDAIVVSAPVADIESHYGTSDTGYYVTPYAMDGEIMDNRGRYHRLSPVQQIHRSRAPVLLLQGADDQRCPLDQCEELFAALVRAGKPVKLVVYPGGAHSMAASGRPSHRVDYHGRFAEWVDCARRGEIPFDEDQAGRGGSPIKVPKSNVVETGSLERQVKGNHAP